MRKLRRLPWRLPKQSAPNEHAPVAREEPEERPELAQPVAYIAGRYVYSPAAGSHHREGPRRGLLYRHRTRAA